MLVEQGFLSRYYALAGTRVQYDEFSYQACSPHASSQYGFAPASIGLSTEYPKASETTVSTCTVIELLRHEWTLVDFAATPAATEREHITEHIVVADFATSLFATDCTTILGTLPSPCSLEQRFTRFLERPSYSKTEPTNKEDKRYCSADEHT